MVQFAGGQFRFAIRDSRGHVVAHGPAIDYTILDNAAVPRAISNQTGTSQDQDWSFPRYCHGTGAEVLCLQVLHTAAITADTSATVAQLQVLRKFRDGDGRIAKDYLSLSLADRITKTGVNPDPQGLDDDVVTVANEWSDVLRYKPRPNENWLVYGYQRVVLDGA